MFNVSDLDTSEGDIIGWLDLALQADKGSCQLSRVNMEGTGVYPLDNGRESGIVHLMATDTALNAVVSANAIVYIPPEGISGDQSIPDDFIHITVDDNGFSGVGSNPYTAEEGVAKFLAPVTISPLIVHPYWTFNGSNFVGAEDEIFSFDGSLSIDPGTFSDSEVIEISVSSSSGNFSFAADPNGVDLLSDSLAR